MDGTPRSPYGPTRAERREEREEKRRTKMNSGKKLKLLTQLIQRRAEAAAKKLGVPLDGEQHSG